MYDAIVLGLGGVGSMALRGLARQNKGSGNGRNGGRVLGIDAHKIALPLPQGKKKKTTEDSSSDQQQDQQEYHHHHHHHHTYGSSHGKTRIFRRAYFEHAGYVPWIQESIQVWKEMETEHDIKLLEECGSLVLEPTTTTTSTAKTTATTTATASLMSANDTTNDNGNHDFSVDDELPPFCRASYKAAVQHGIDVKILDQTMLTQRFPQFTVTTRNAPNQIQNQPQQETFMGVWEPDGGFVRCERVMQAALAEARAAPHVDILSETKVMDIMYKDDSTMELHLETTTDDRDGKVFTQKNVVTTKCLLVAMGGWTGQLFPSWKPHLTLMRQFQAWVPAPSQQAAQGDNSKSNLYGYEKMPAWVLAPNNADDLPLYGVPCDQQETDVRCQNFLKIGIHGRKDYIVDPQSNPRIVSDAERQEVLDAARRVMPDVDHQVAEIMPCFYTMTADSHFMLGTPLSLQTDAAGNTKHRVFCVAGLSGHGYKMTPALGQLLVDYALKGKNAVTEHQDEDGNRCMHFCDSARFGV